MNAQARRRIETAATERMRARGMGEEDIEEHLEFLFTLLDPDNTPEAK